MYSYYGHFTKATHLDHTSETHNPMTQTKFNDDVLIDLTLALRDGDLENNFSLKSFSFHLTPILYYHIYISELLLHSLLRILCL